MAYGTPDVSNRTRMPDFTGRPYPYPSHLDQFIADAAALNKSGKNIYYGICLRTKTWERGRGTADNVMSSSCLWVDIDFKTVPEEKAKQVLSAFALPPSAGVRSGGGIQALWLLKEPATDEALRKIQPTNNALATFLGGDLVGDLPRVFRLPDTLNHKYEPSMPCFVKVWHPERRYNLSDFDFLPVAVPPQPAPSGTSTDPPSPGTSLADEVHWKVVKHLKAIWLPGSRRRMSLFVAGLLAHSGYNEESALKVVRDVTEVAGDEEADTRPRQVVDTYKKYRESKPVGGAPQLERLIDERFPAEIRSKAQMVVQLIRSSVRKAGEPTRRGPKAAANFKIVSLVKFDSRPAIYSTTIQTTDEKTVTVDTETQQFFFFSSFRMAAYEQGNVILKASQGLWEQMVGETVPEIREAPKESTAHGELEATFEDFLERKVDATDPNILNKVPGFDEHRVFFKLNAIRSHIKDAGVKVGRNSLTRFLKDRGFESKPMWFGKTNEFRVWTKESNGSAG